MTSRYRRNQQHQAGHNHKPRVITPCKLPCASRYSSNREPTHPRCDAGHAQPSPRWRHSHWRPGASSLRRRRPAPAGTTAWPSGRRRPRWPPTWLKAWTKPAPRVNAGPRCAAAAAWCRPSSPATAAIPNCATCAASSKASAARCSRATPSCAASRCRCRHAGCANWPAATTWSMCRPTAKSAPASACSSASAAPSAKKCGPPATAAATPGWTARAWASPCSIRASSAATSPSATA
jgi:hypothetical protein